MARIELKGLEKRLKFSKNRKKRSKIENWPGEKTALQPPDHTQKIRKTCIGVSKISTVITLLLTLILKPTKTLISPQIGFINTTFTSLSTKEIEGDDSLYAMVVTKNGDVYHTKKGLERPKQVQIYETPNFKYITKYQVLSAVHLSKDNILVLYEKDKQLNFQKIEFENSTTFYTQYSHSSHIDDSGTLLGSNADLPVQILTSPTHPKKSGNRFITIFNSGIFFLKFDAKNQKIRQFDKNFAFFFEKNKKKSNFFGGILMQNFYEFYIIAVRSDPESPGKGRYLLSSFRVKTSGENHTHIRSVDCVEDRASGATFPYIRLDNHPQNRIPSIKHSWRYQTEWFLGIFGIRFGAFKMIEGAFQEALDVYTTLENTNLRPAIIKGIPETVLFFLGAISRKVEAPEMPKML